MVTTLQSRDIRRSNSAVILHPASRAIDVNRTADVPKKIALPTADGVRFVRQTLVEYCKSEGNYCHIQLASGESILIAKTLKWVAVLLDSNRFIRVHASYVIACDKVELLSRENLTMESGKCIPISRSKRSEIRDTILAKAIV